MYIIRSKRDTVHALASTVAELVHLDATTPQIKAACKRIFDLTPLELLQLDDQISSCRLIKEIGGE